MSVFHGSDNLARSIPVTAASVGASGKSSRLHEDVSRRGSKRRYLILFRGKGLRESLVEGNRSFYTPRTATRPVVGFAPPRGKVGCTLYRSIGEVRGAVDADLSARKTWDATASVDDYQLVAVEVPRGE